MAMKNAMEELHDTQVEFVKNPILGANETITYTHNSGTVVENLGVFVDKPKFNDEIKGNQRQDSITFTNTLLSEKPTNLDTLEYNSETYRVKEWRFATGLYIILAYANKRHSVSHR